MDPVVVQENLLKDVVALIQLYRAHILFIPQTTFHRAISAHIQTVLTSMDDVRPVGTPHPHSRRLDAGTKGADSMSATESMPGGLSLGSERPSVFASALTFKPEVDMGGDKIITRLKQSIVGLLPDRHYWHGNLFQFMDSDSDGILEQLGKSA
nr:hypothetical protein HK105_000099 [Polyrhizophydium stewartii]